MTVSDERLATLLHRAGLSQNTALTEALGELTERRVAPVQTAVEWMNGHFMKVHLHGLPVPAVLHRFTAADGPDAAPHDHPWPFTSFILSGGYEEEIFSEKWGIIGLKVREPGDSLFNRAGTIHRIVQLLADECWTLILPGEWERKPGFYEWRDGETWHRFWDEPEFQRLADRNDA